MPDASVAAGSAGPRPVRAALGFLRGQPFAVAGLAIYLTFVVLALFAEQIATHDPRQILFSGAYRVARYLPPSADHFLGTTAGGRDIFSQLVHGTRSALRVGVTAAFFVVCIGALLGLLSGYLGGWVDRVIMRVADVVLGLPFLPFVLVISALTRPGTTTIVASVALLLWPNTARVIRSQVLSLRERGWVEAARVTGCSPARIIFVHIAPQVAPLAALYGSIAVGWAILTEASASFLGFGDPAAISWGLMLQDAFANQALSRGAWNWFIPPGLCIVLMVMAGFLISRGSEKLLFPKLGDSMAALLSVRDLAVHYRTPAGPVRAVDGASFDVPAGGIVGLVGESGCGKSTLGRALMGVMPRTARVAAGTALFEGRDLVTLSPAERRALLWRRLAFVPQTAMNALDPVQRVGAQLTEVLTERGGLSRRAAASRAEALFALVGLDARRLRDWPHQFSGGMRQRASIALALALEPALLIADEPVTALDVIVQRQILDVMKDLQARMGLAMILVTHDVAVVAYACDRVVVMYAGRVVESGPVRAVLEAPLHPYTMGLMNAFPDLERAGGELVPIEGSPPSLLDPPAGCRFAARCPFAVARCAEDPPLTEETPDHHAACWRADEAPALRAMAAEAATWAR